MTLHTFQIYPGVDPCNGIQYDRQGHWSNQTGVPIYLKALRLWMGASRGVLGDFVGSVWLARSNTDIQLLLSEGWDRYGAGDGAHAVPWSFAPDWIEMPPHTWITLHRTGTPAQGVPLAVPQPQMLQTLMGWYTVGAP